MNQQNKLEQQSSSAAAELLSECEELLRQLAHHRYAASLLTKCRDYLRMSLNYKSGRRPS